MKKILLFLAFLALALYSLFQARFIILGPDISVTSPLDEARVTTRVIDLVGNAQNISYISVNDRPIFISEKGDSNEKLIVENGLSIITIRAKDRFGRQTEKTIRVVYNNWE